MAHLHQGGTCITVCTGVDSHYRVYARHFGHQIWHQVGKRTKSKGVAMRRMARAFDEQGFKRAMVAYCADYYDPTPICELVRK